MSRNKNRSRSRSRDRNQNNNSGFKRGRSPSPRSTKIFGTDSDPINTIITKYLPKALGHERRNDWTIALSLYEGELNKKKRNKEQLCEKEQLCDTALLSKVSFCYERLGKLEEAKKYADQAIVAALKENFTEILPRMYHSRARIGAKLVPDAISESDVINPLPLSQAHKLELEVSIGAATKALEV